MIKLVNRIKVIIIFWVGSSSPIFCQSLVLPSIFSDNMVIQRNMEAPIWGQARQGETIRIEIANTSRVFVVDKTGYWSGRLPELKVGQVYQLKVSSGKNHITINNIVAGDVFFAGGQSNMQYSMQEVPSNEREINSASNKNIRLFTVPRDIAYHPRFDINRNSKEDDQEGRWNICSPESVKNFSAIGYFFARQINSSQNVPVGIINVTWGGTPIEAHMSLEANVQLPYFGESLEEVKSKTVKDSLVIDRKTATPQLPSTLFNAMIHPLIPYGLKAILWYQGEHNWNRPFRYRQQFAVFISDLRVRWRQGYLPFYFFQLPGIGEKETKTEHFWPVLRESQAKALTLPYTRMVVTLDIGDGDIHPKNKKAFAERLSNSVLHDLYDVDAASAAPEFKESVIVRDTVEIYFSGGTVKYKPIGNTNGFMVAGVDKIFYPANVLVKENKVLVFTNRVKNIKAVRYAWAENPDISLFGDNGVPVAPFRTDDFHVREDGTW